jgi:PRTRC genetic system protein D
MDMSAAITIALDIGSGLSKARSDTTTAQFPSIAGPPLPEVYALKRDPGAYVSFGNKEFVVGERALSAVRPTDIVDSRTDRWHETDGYRALMYSGLARVLPAGYNGRVAVATGLPIGFYRTAKDELVEMLVGEHRFAVGGVAYKVVIRRPECFVLPQAAGLYMRHLEIEKGSAGERSGFIDVGTYTTGWLQTERLEILQYSTNGVRTGIGDVKEALSEYLVATYRMHATRSTVDTAIETGRVRVGGEWVDLRDAIDGIAMACSETLRLALRESWGAAKESSIYVGGGGAAMFYPSIRTVYPHAQLIKGDKPQLAVLDGYFAFAKTKTRVAASVA